MSKDPVEVNPPLRRKVGSGEKPPLGSSLQTFCPPGEETPTRFWLRLPPHWERGDPHPLLVFLHSQHGNHRWPWSLPQLQTLREGLLGAGFICVSPDLGPNHWMNAGTRKKLARILDWLPERWPIDPGRIHLFGLSMGGSGSLIFAAHHPDRVRKVGSGMGVTDFTRFYAEGPYSDFLRQAFGGSPTEVPKVYAAQSVLCCAPCLAGVPVLILHGTEDSTVPLDQARRFVARMGDLGQEVIYYEVQGARHGPEIVQGYEARIVQFFQA